jgi:uncharacterized membrane protein YqjE
MALPAQVRSADLRLGVQGLTVESAIDHLVDAAQGVVENQLELARLEVELTMGRVLRSAALVLVGMLLLVGAIAPLGMAAYAAFPEAYSPAARLAILGGAIALVGCVLMLLGVRRMDAHGRD